MKKLYIFLIYLIGTATCALYADPQNDLANSIYETLSKKKWVEKRFAFIVLPDGRARCSDSLRNRKKEEELGVLLESLGAKNYVRDFSIDEEKVLNPDRQLCPMALYKTEKVDFIVTVNILAGVYKGYLSGLKLEDYERHFTFGKTDPTLQATLLLETEGKEPIELKIHKDVRNLKIRAKFLNRITGMPALTDLEELRVDELELQNIPKFDFDRPYKLAIFHNYIKDLHATDFDQNAFSVDISWNLIEDDTWFCDIATIKEIHISRNKLRTADCLLSNDHVEKVKSSFNYISNIKARKLGKKIKFLDISYNGIRSFPWNALNESGMKDLNLSNNHLYDIAVIDLSTIETVDLSNNPILKVVIGEKSKNLKLLKVSTKTVVDFKNPIKRCEAGEKADKQCVSVEYE
ncbi:leucine-rich repeat domain-containing protein [Leptospira alexanderi]|uniref:leucine-rich repeat domain-containing protein n=1 Tax=Leptospira alexanderi TaxID=100053 RepID=UPI0009914288|nr:leucine-rich repeat domain-containing protein [Leptospira alexanderi]